MRIGNDFPDAGSWFVHMNTIQNQWETQSDVKNDLAVNWGGVHYFAIQPNQPENWLIEKISNFCNFVIFDQRSMKLSTHVFPEVLNQIISSLLAQQTKKASYRDFSKNN